MTDVADLVRRADEYATRAGIEPTTVSKKLFKDARRLDQLRLAPDGIKVSTIKKAVALMSDLERAEAAKDAAA